MKRLSWLTAASLLLAGCGLPGSPPAAATALPALASRPYSNLAQMMRAIPFPSSNIIFDTQSQDPATPKKVDKVGGGATADFASVYGGWQAVENNALALAETANLLAIPGRFCENGRPVPLDREDFRRFAEGLARAGEAAYKAAQSKNVDAMVDVSGTVSDACASCHEVYRDKEDPKNRCIP